MCLEGKENSVRAAGAGDSEIIEYLKAANASMNAMLNDATRFVTTRSGQSA